MSVFRFSNISMPWSKSKTDNMPVPVGTEMTLTDHEMVTTPLRNDMKELSITPDKSGIELTPVDASNDKTPVQSTAGVIPTKEANRLEETLVCAHGVNHIKADSSVDQGKNELDRNGKICHSDKEKVGTSVYISDETAESLDVEKDRMLRQGGDEFTNPVTDQSTSDGQDIAKAKNSEAKRKCNRVGKKKCGIIALSVTAVVLVILIVLVAYFKCQDEMLINNETTSGDRHQYVTIPCDDVSLSVDEDKVTFNNTNLVEIFADNQNRNICTFSNIMFVVEKMTERQARLRLANGKFPPQPVSCGNPAMARKSGVLTGAFTHLSPHQDFTGTDDKIILWNNLEDQAIVGPGLTYSNGRIRVNETQYYFVYASLTFNLTMEQMPTDDTHRPFDDLAFRFYVSKSRAGYTGPYETRLMEYTQMLCDKSGGFVSSHVGSQLLLNPEEELYVKVSDPHRLVRDPDTRGNTFGLFPVS